MSGRIELSDSERLILANQYKIMSMVAPKDEREDYARLSDALFGGYPWLYMQSLENYLSPNLPDADARHVLDILGLYSDLKASYGALKDQSGITEHDVTFPGFDGNNEAELMAFAGELAKHRRYASVLGDDGYINSHCPTNDTYARMLGAWRKLGKPRYPMSKDDITTILAARRYSAD